MTSSSFHYIYLTDGFKLFSSSNSLLFMFTAVCPSSFTYDDTVKGCYKARNVVVDWPTAATYCQDLVPNGHLDFINSSLEQASVSTVAATTGNFQCKIMHPI